MEENCNMRKNLKTDKWGNIKIEKKWINEIKWISMEKF